MFAVEEDKREARLSDARGTRTGIDELCADEGRELLCCGPIVADIDEQSRRTSGRDLCVKLVLLNDCHYEVFVLPWQCPDGAKFGL